jgi:hypothetical protein
MRNRVFPFSARWSALALTAAALVLAVSAPASASAAPFTAHLKAPNHTPTAGKKWPITVTATRGHTKLSGSVRYQFLFDGTVESNQPGHSFKRGVFHDTLLFPKEAVGYPLTLRVIVKTRYGTVDLNWSVKTKA